MAIVRVSIKDNPVLAFVENIMAYDLSPYSVETRRQLSGSMLAMISTGRAQIEPEAAEIVWEVSQTVSPLDAAGLVGRAAYLLNYGHADQLDPIAVALKRVMPWAIETWIIEAYAALVANDRARAEHAIAKASTSQREDTVALNALAEQLRRLP